MPNNKIVSRSGKSKRSRFNRCSKGQRFNGATLKLKAHIMFDATINTSVSSTKQVNVIPYLGLFPVALEQSKFYQQYRITSIKVSAMPLTATNTLGSTLSPTSYLYTIPLYNNSLPIAS